MSFNKYEVIYMVKPDVREDEILKLIKQYHSLVKQCGGKNIFMQHQGRRHLSYEIAKYRDAIYIQMNFEGNGKLVQKLAKNIRFDDNIIRHLTSKQIENHKEVVLSTL
uniref:Small ribosomal subunit protein bS6c n=1 Tax=Yamadaella caenomyce TaxID=259029 RepID=A0A1G4NYD7_9FLOR|nr:Ribosomal protein S6 [Yamadaella caenomyce]SCW23700.1 Ribosomal protein S6 [Yamadaella caenomyce]